MISILNLKALGAALFVLTILYNCWESYRMKNTIEQQIQKIQQLENQIKIVEIQSQLSADQWKKLDELQVKTQSQIQSWNNWIRTRESRESLEKNLKSSDTETINTVNRFIKCNTESFGELKDCRSSNE